MHAVRSRTRAPLLLAACLALVALSPAIAGFDERKTFDGDQLLIRNLIGRIDIQGHSGSEFEVEIRVRGRDATADLVRIDADEVNYSELIVEFPLDESRRYVYPELGRSSVKFGDDSGGGWLSGLFGSSRKIEVTGSGRGLEIWADATVKVPHGKTLKIEHGVGEIHATDVEASLDLACHTCPIEVVGMKGRVDADTGSGSVWLENVRGDIAADTGSGRVSLIRCEGGSVDVDTGSGRVNAQSVGADELTIDTGSGSVELQLDRMGGGSFEIDTGSGRVELQLPTDASARIFAETGSGGIHLDLDEGYTLIEKEKDACELQVGGGDAVVRLDTGSGSIRISQ